MQRLEENLCRNDATYTLCGALEQLSSLEVGSTSQLHFHFKLCGPWYSV